MRQCWTRSKAGPELLHKAAAFWSCLPPETQVVYGTNLLFLPQNPEAKPHWLTLSCFLLGPHALLLKRGGPLALYPIFLCSTYSGNALLAQPKDHIFSKRVGATISQHCHHTTLLPALQKASADHLPRESAVLDPKSSCRHRCSGKKSPWPSEAVLILQFPSPAATCCNSSKIPAQRMPRKIHPMVVFPKCWLQG